MGKGKMEDQTLINIIAPTDCDKYIFKALLNVVALETDGILTRGGDFNIAFNHK